MHACRHRRWVLFFTIVPTFASDAEEEEDAEADADAEDGGGGGADAEAFGEVLGEYDPEAQIHAVWLLWRAAEAVREPQRVVEAYRRLGFDLDAFGKAP